MTTSTPPAAKSTTAFFVQSALSFGVSLVSTSVGIANLGGSAWMRGFLTLGLLYVVTSAFGLAKCVRDHQEASAVISRVDQVRLDRFLTEHDPYRQPTA
jgi:hypothetical protein